MRAIELGPDAEGELFRLRYEWTQLSLLQGFDELLCLPTLHGVETYWYQVEAVRKVLKQFHGRVCWPMRSASTKRWKPVWCSKNICCAAWLSAS